MAIKQIYKNKKKKNKKKINQLKIQKTESP